MATNRRTLSGVTSNGKRRVLTGQGSFGIHADTSGLESLLDAIGEAAESAVRPAAQAGAQVLYNGVRANVGQIGRVSGNLEKSIYQYYSHEKSVEGLKATYHVSWNHTKAPHGQLLERGWLQRYAVRLSEKGQWVTLVRPEAQGKPKPRRRASQAEKDAYYVPRAGGPRWMPGRWFLARAADQMGEAYQAANEELLMRVNEVKKL